MWASEWKQQQERKNGGNRVVGPDIMVEVEWGQQHSGSNNKKGRMVEVRVVDAIWWG